MKGYSDKQARRAAAAKARAQTLIAKDFAALIAAAQERLCQAKCRWWRNACEHGLLPLTLKGEDCPYYEQPPLYHR